MTSSSSFKIIFTEENITVSSRGADGSSREPRAEQGMQTSHYITSWKTSVREDISWLCKPFSISSSSSLLFFTPSHVVCEILQLFSLLLHSFYLTSQTSAARYPECYCSPMVRGSCVNASQTRRSCDICKQQCTLPGLPQGPSQVCMHLGARGPCEFTRGTGTAPL